MGLEGKGGKHENLQPRTDSAEKGRVPRKGSHEKFTEVWKIPEAETAEACWDKFETRSWKERPGKERRAAGGHQTPLQDREKSRAEWISVAERIQAVQELRILQLEAEGQHSDLVQYVRLRERAYGVVGIIDEVVKDDALWRSIRETALRGDRLTPDLLQRVEPIAWEALPALLEIAGYRAPPPVEELVQDTIKAVTDGSAPSASNSAPEERIEHARAVLGRFVTCARNDLGIRVEDKNLTDILRPVDNIVRTASELLVLPLIMKWGEAAAQQLDEHGGFLAKAAAGFLRATSGLVPTLITWIGRHADPETDDTSHSVAEAPDWRIVHSASILVQLHETQQAHQALFQTARLPSEEEEQARQTAWSNYRWALDHARLRLGRLEQVLTSSEQFTGQVEEDITSLHAEINRIAPLLESDVPPNRWPTNPVDGTREDLDVGQLVGIAACLDERIRSL